MTPAIELNGVRKDYRGLRPLRLRELAVADHEIVAVEGLDAQASEVLTNLITGGTLPDEGSVRVFGHLTSATTDADAWLATLDRFGIVSDRVALVDAFTVRQNVAIALTLDLEPIPDPVAAAAGRLATEAGVDEGLLDKAIGLAPASARFRARLARAVAASPRILLAEQPTASLPRADVARVAADFFRLVRDRRLAVLITSGDRDFTAGADRRETLDPATGALMRRGLRALFSRAR